MCFWLAKEAKGRQAVGLPERIAIDFFPPDALHRDDDNMIGAFKHGRDGIAAALGHDDRHWRNKVTNTFHPPFRPNGKIVVQIEVAA
jgi:crossover junction endodeoxyribonuclease RusA